MINPKELKILIYSLDLIGNFSTNVDLINSGEEFFKIHNRSINTLSELSTDRNTNFFTNKIKEYPKFSIIEIDEYVKENKKGTSLFSVLAGPFLAIFEFFFKTIKNKGVTLNTRKKLNDLKTINDSLTYMIENPGFEKLLKD